MQEQAVPKLVVTRQEAARALRGTTKLVDELTRSGDLIPVRIGTRVLFAWAELERLIKQRRNGSSRRRISAA